MSKILKTVNWSKGLNKDLPPYELGDGYCSDASNMRFRNGMAERINGITTMQAASVVPYWLCLYQSVLSAKNAFLVYTGLTKAYAYNFSSTESEITRYTEGVAISSSTNVTTTATVTTAVAHGRSTGNTISRWGAFPDAYNGTFVITVTGANTYTYTMLSDPGGSATTQGLYSYNGATQNFSGTTDDRNTGGVLNGVLFINNPIDGLYYWNGDIGTRLRKFPGSNVSDVARPFKNYIVQLASTVNGVKRRHNVAWSAAAPAGAIPTSFTAAATNDAGDWDLSETGGSVVDAVALGDVLIIYKSDARYAMQYVGGEKVFSFFKLPGNTGLLNRDCAVDTPIGHVYLTPSLEVMVHQGGEARNISRGRIEKYLYTQAYINFKTRHFLAVHGWSKEVWIFCQTTSGFCDQALVWNWEEDTWGIKDLTNYKVTHGVGGNSGDYTISAQIYVGCDASTLGALQESVFRDGASYFTSMVERRGLHFGDMEFVKHFSRSRHHIDAAPGTEFTVYHGTQMNTSQSAATYSSGVTYTVDTTNYADARATAGRYLAVKVTFAPTLQATSKMKLRTSELEYSLGGRR